MQKEIMKRETAYFKPNTRISNFIPVPRSILGEDLTASAKLVYGLLVARTMLSQKATGRTWTDGDGNVFILFSIRSLAEEARMAESTVKNALRELKKRELKESDPVKVRVLVEGVQEKLGVK